MTDIIKNRATVVTSIVSVLALTLEQVRLSAGSGLRLDVPPSDIEIDVAARGARDMINPALEHDGGKPLAIETIKQFADTAWKTLRRIRSGQLPEPVYNGNH